ncbi:SDR family NAD(P)-dependent oxidoreductase [Clostridium felsineum]|uniref:Uncharacterized protein n=1 Tax=Clostridium felsineum TaxID=36839 RepID=A0A1S8MHJ8_9CLOT|nr:SDR family NAD(P)-dependent oxidoreductase [Clostridium felsineum]URZ07046.1 hypothetical protein CLROS_023790 [Clostridium felsineum]URZ12076.1 hypothetical protein CROST_027930 [Clostridium felsineum]
MSKLKEINKYILQQVSENNMDEKMAFEILTEINNRRSKENKDIAIIGMSCRLPGIKNVDEYWKVLVNNMTTVGGFPKKRRDNIDEYLSEELINLKNPYFTAGYLEEVDKFDPKFFNLSPVEAEVMEPAQRLFLETAYEAFEDAGYGRKKIFNTNTGVFVGRDNTNNSGYINILENQDIISLIGSYTSILASRLSFAFNLHGPCTVMDTACSSGLVSVHTACKSLLNKECSMAVAGGIQIFFAPTSDNNMLGSVEARGNEIRAFDKKATGTVWGEGAAMLLLKPLNRAIEDKDSIYAVIKGSAVNNDGLSSALTAPNLEAQTDVILKAWKKAKIDPETISYIETHGTGTVLGDPLEIKGLKNAFEKYTNKKQFCGVGSVKTNIGHTVAVSGIASIIKVVLAMKNNKIPASLHFDEPNPYIEFLNSPVYLNDTLRQWEKNDDNPLRAGVTSLGFSGTNCHIVLEEASLSLDENEYIKENDDILVLSAKGEKELRNLVNKYIDYLEVNEVNVNRLSYTNNTGRGDYEYRLALVFDSKDDLLKKLNLAYYKKFEDINKEDIFYGQHRVVTENKRNKKKEEITERERRVLDEEVIKIIDNNLKSKQSKRNICSYYVKGAKINWDSFYKNKKIKRIHLPTYPYKKEKFWPKYNDKVNKNTIKKELKHPFLQRCLVKSFDEDVYLIRLDSKMHFAVREHKIQGNFVVPGTSYVEIAKEIASMYFENNIEIKDLLFQTPILVMEQKFSDIQLVVKKDEKDCFRLIFTSKKDDVWTIHGECKICNMVNLNEDKYNIEKLISCFKIRKDDMQSEKLDSIFSFGPRWNSIESFATDENENVLLKINLPIEFSDDLKEYNLHPSLLDNAVNGMIKGMKKDPYLPLLYKSFKIYKNIPIEFYSYIKKTSKSLDSELLTFDIIMLDLEGEIIGEIKEYTIKKTSEKELDFDINKKSYKYKNENIYHTLKWVKEKNEVDVLSRFDKEVIIFKGNNDLNNKLCNKIKEKVKNTIEIEFGNNYCNVNENKYIINNLYEDYFKLFDKLKDRQIGKIIFLNDVYASDYINLIDVYKNKQFFNLYYMVKALNKNSYIKDLEIIVICSYSDYVNGSEKIVNPNNSLAIGMGKVITQEHSNLKCRIIDIDEKTELNKIANEIIRDKYMYLTAYREGNKYIQQFSYINNKDVVENNIKIEEGEVYIITGGTGGIGIQIAQYLASKGKVKICLVNRSGFPESHKWNDILRESRDSKLCSKIKALKDIKEQGSIVDVFAIDVSNYSEMEQLIFKVKELYGDIKGIFHCAGVAGDKTILRKNIEDFNKVLKPKVDGTWVIGKIVEKENIDFVMLFSSIVSVLGGHGQADYAAANMYLDAYSSYWKSKKSKTKFITVGWPAWKETGMAVDYKVNNTKGIIKSIDNKKAIEIIDDLLRKDITYVVVGEIDFTVLSEVKNNYYINISKEIFNNISIKNSKIRNIVINKDIVLEGKENNIYSSLEKEIGNCFGHILGLDNIDVNEDFFEIGGNSILEVKLQVELEKRGINVTNNDIYTHRTVSNLAKFLESGNITDTSKKAILKNEENKLLNEGNVNHGKNEKIVAHVEPFNDLFYKNCFYNSVFPIVKYYKKDIGYIMANDVITYSYSDNNIKVKYNEIELMDNVVSSMGIKCNAEIKVENIIETTKNSIDKDNFVIVWIDVYYEVQRKEVYNKIHMPHTLLIYGYNDADKVFHIIEHKHKDSLSYRETIISYEDLINCYNGYLKNLQQEVNKESYYEFNIINKNNKEKENCSLVYSRNYLNSLKIIEKGLDKFDCYIQYLKTIIINENKLKENTEKILKEFNDIINYKLVEQYRISKLFSEEKELQDLLKDIIDIFSSARAEIAKYLYLGRYNKDYFSSLYNQLEKLKNLEIRYNSVQKKVAEILLNECK